MADAPHSTRSDPLPISTGTRDQLERALDRLPFRAHLSFEALFEELRRLVEGSPNERCRQARGLLESLAALPALRGEVVPPAAVAEHADAVRALMSFLFPELDEDRVLGRAFVPFAPTSFFSTRRYREVFGAEDAHVSQGNGVEARDYYRENMLFAYLMVQHLHYGVLRSHSAFVKRVRTTSTGLDRFFLVDGTFRFARVSLPRRDLPPAAEFARLLDMEALDRLVQRFPLDGAVFSGFITIRYHEITEIHNLSLLKSELVEPAAIASPGGFARIGRRLRSVLQIPDLEAGIVSRRPSMGEHEYCLARSLVAGLDGALPDVGRTVYGQVVESREPRFVPDLSEWEDDSGLPAELRARGVRSLGLIPLVEGGEAIGILELASRRPNEIHPASAKRLADVIGPLTVAVRRQTDEVVARIERTIKDHCTAIHPSVEWRFEDAAYRYNRELDETGSARFEDITFEDVYPLYAAMDIRGSSESRNRAIQGDLVEQIDLAAAALARIHAVHPMPIAHYYGAALGRMRASVAGGLASGDEATVAEFLRARIEPFLGHVRAHLPPGAGEAAAAIEAYHAALDPLLGVLHRRRRGYEESVARVNDALVAVLDEEQARAQAIFPHYFEKYKTDGVEHGIYVGQSMTRGRRFDRVELENLRLWQLELMCTSARRAAALLPHLDVPLAVTPLVLVQSQPITIQFKTEEKHFAVEGSYNVRYEIIKKRIDKSRVRGTGERLTQPGYLSVIYAQDRERDEYRRYFEYLAGRGCLAPEVEDLELEDLQGVHGLRALRAAIVLEEVRPGPGPAAAVLRPR